MSLQDLAIGLLIIGVCVNTYVRICLQLRVTELEKQVRELRKKAPK